MKKTAFDKAMQQLKTSLKENKFTPEQIERLADSLHSFKPVLGNEASINFLTFNEAERLRRARGDETAYSG